MNHTTPGINDSRKTNMKSRFTFGVSLAVAAVVGLAACGSAPASPRQDGCVEVSAWLFAEDAAQASISFRRAADMVDFFSELVGPYPFEKLAHVQSATRFGGMENASAIFYSERRLASGASLEGTVAHETAHQWFGDAVTAEDWTELWLSEGFATYFEFAVGLMLVALGAQVLWNLARRRLHLHEHLDGGEPHVHIHASHKHGPELSTSTGHGDGGHSHGLWSSLRPNFRPRSFAIGMVHGLAGQGLLHTRPG